MANDNIFSELPSSLLEPINAPQAAFNASGKDDDPLCLPNTRVQVLQQIREWTSGNNEQYIFWLSGWAGTGKSTIARTIAREYYDQNYFTASFFFSRGGGDVSHAQKFVGTIASQLAERCASFRASVKAILNNKSIENKCQNDQWNELILQPLSKLGANSLNGPLLIVIDALDECDEGDIGLVLQLLSGFQSLGQVHPRVFITSRPDIPVQHGFKSVPNEIHQDFVLHDIDQFIVDDDIRKYIQHTLSNTQQKHDLAENWLGENVIRLLTQKAAGLFIWAATACRFIDEGGSDFGPKRLSDILEGSNSIKPEEELNRIYLKVLRNSTSPLLQLGEKEKTHEDLRRALGVITTLFSPLPALSIAQILHISEQKISSTLRGLHSILDIPKDPARPIRLHHPSFRDFLLDRTRCKDPNFWVDEKQAHGGLAVRCITLMETSLKQNICEIQAPGTLLADISRSGVDECIPAEAQYACLYWIQHTERTQDRLYNNGPLHGFLKKHFLHWLEALVLMHKTADGAIAMASLEVLIQHQSWKYSKKTSSSPQTVQKSLRSLQSPISQKHSNEGKFSNTELYLFVQDAKKFILFAQPITQNSPLQLYCSALLFAPEKSIIKNRFKSQIPCWFDYSPLVDSHWSALLQTLEGHTEAVHSVAFSPDGERIASGSQDHTVRVCDAATGKQLRILKGHTDGIHSVIFLPNHNRIASGSHDCTVRVWDAASGKLLNVLEGNTDWGKEPIFSPKDSRIACFSTGNIVLVYNTVTNMSLRTLRGHTDTVECMAFSPNGDRIASGSRDRTIRIWDVVRGKLLQILKNHNHWVQSIAFSPDGGRILSGSYDCTIRVWEAASSKPLRILKNHRVQGMAFSSNSVRIAPGDHLASMEELLTGKPSRIPKGRNPFTSLAFSPNRIRVAPLSNDRLAAIDELLTGKPPRIPRGRNPLMSFLRRNQFIQRRAFLRHALNYSLDSGTIMYTLSRILPVRDAAGDLPLPTLEGHTNFKIQSMAFSPDGGRVASGSVDHTVRVWDTVTGKLLQIFKGHIDWVQSVAFSPDGGRIVSESVDHTVRVWDTVTGKLLRTLEGHHHTDNPADGIHNVAFSPRSDRTASMYRSIDQFHIPTKYEPPETLEDQFYSRSQNVVFSPDGDRIASGSRDRIVRVWDAATGKLLRTLEGHTDFVQNVAFSPDVLTYSIDESNQWITKDNLRVLFIPFDYRPGVAAIHSNMLAIGSKSGRVTIFSFRSTVDKLAL